MYVSRFYHWRSGSWQGACTHGEIYQLKPDAPHAAVEMLSKTTLVPMVEQLLADGTIIAYAVDATAIHTQSPDMFAVVYITLNAEGLGQVDAALRETVKHHPLIGPALDAMAVRLGSARFGSSIRYRSRRA